jgi:putative NIF3 family GTP cyclohydrolase 1 type 2
MLDLDKNQSDPLISTLAIGAGAGASILNDVQADAYLSGEMEHHDVLNAVYRGISVILCEHTNTERGYLADILRPLLQKKLGNDINVICSSNDIDPIHIE